MPAFTAPPELITSLTDIINGIFSFFIIFWLYKKNAAKEWKYLFITLTVSNLFGGVIHLFDFSALFDKIAWIILIFIMYVTAALFAVCSVKLTGAMKQKTAFEIFGIATVLGYAMIIIDSISKDFKVDIKVYVVFAAICLIYSLVILIISYLREKSACKALFALSMIVQVPGGIVQAQRTLKFHFIWDLDYNTVYHLILAASVILIFIGLISLEKEKKSLR
ncbi:MAG: hypothetical protein KBS59_02685 [Clostridiales bacterium]|nr:hypothetical protein [Clostridiales bacterium]